MQFAAPAKESLGGTPVRGWGERRTEGATPDAPGCAKKCRCWWRGSQVRPDSLAPRREKLIATGLRGCLRPRASVDPAMLLD